MNEEAVTFHHIRFMVRDPDDVLAPGIALKVYTNVTAVPREFEIIRVNGQKYQIVEGGVLWNFVYEGILTTIIVEKVPE